MKKVKIIHTRSIFVSERDKICLVLLGSERDKFVLCGSNEACGIFLRKSNREIRFFVNISRTAKILAKQMKNLLFGW
jgi:hypothetical protein